MEDEYNLDGAAEAENWVYRGEGAMNVVLVCNRSRSTYVGKILRLKKIPNHKTSSKSHGPVHTESESSVKPTTLAPHESDSLGLPHRKGERILSPEEGELWSDYPKVASASTSADLAHAFAESVIRPLLGHTYVDPGHVVDVSPSFLQAVANSICPQRPRWRVEQASLDLNATKALLMSDLSLLTSAPSGGMLNKPETICVELKPKCGFLPTSPHISEATEVKFSVPRFQLHQQLKFHKGEVDSVSEYNPLNLFSHEKHRIQTALEALFRRPQNNLRVFRSGVEIFGGETKKTSLGGRRDREVELEVGLEGFVDVAQGRRSVCLLNVLRDVLFHADVLQSLLAAQKLDRLDIEGVLLIYNKHVLQNQKSQKKDNDPSSIETKAYTKPRTRSDIDNLTSEERRKVLQDFLIATTAKDCGLMITFEPVNDIQLHQSGPSVICEASGGVFSYEISFLDLDLKPLNKLPHYYAMDQEIALYYHAHLNNQ